MKVAIEEAMTAAHISINVSGTPYFNYYASEKGYTSLENSSEIAQVIMQGSKKDKSTELKIFDRFIDPNDDTALAVKEKKAKQKRVKRFAELRKKVEEKRAKLAKKQAEKANKQQTQQALKQIKEFFR